MMHNSKIDILQPELKPNSKQKAGAISVRPSIAKPIVMRSLPIAEIISADQPWSLYDVLNKLIEASEILLHKKNYDGHGWEEIHYAVERAKQIAGLFEGNDA